MSTPPPPVNGDNDSTLNTPAWAHPVERRTIMQGAAWTIPVVAVAIGAPLAAASAPFTCPVVPTPSAWVPVVPASGQLSAAGTTSATATDFFSQKDAVPATGPATATFTTIIPVVAGHTYTFTFQEAGAYANGGGTRSTVGQGLRVTFGSNMLYQGYTRTVSGYDLIPTVGPGQPLQYGTRTVTFTATTTENLPFRYTFLLDAQPNTGYAGNDDLHVTAPTLACS